MYNKQQLKAYLEEISENAKFPVFKFVSAEKYSIVIKCHVEKDRDPQYYNDYTKQWINKFSKFTKTGWIVRKCFPNLKRLLYRKVYVCHLACFNKKKPTDQPGTARNKECEAKIDFKMKFINRNTIRNDKSLKEGLNLNIYIDFTHSHVIKARESVHLLKCLPEIDEIFYKYFSEGHTVTSARSYHKLSLLSKYGAASVECAANSEINPTIQHVIYLFYKKKKEGFNHNIADIMAERKKVLEECGGVLNYTDDYSITVIITPFMKNVLTGHDLDNVIIDSTPLKECVVSLFFVPTPMGALPIACALHLQNTEPSFSQAFFSTKLLIEHQTLKSFDPQNITVNAIDEQKQALDSIFSNKKLFVSHTSMAEEIWKTISDVKSKIEGKNRHSLMLLFHLLLHADNLEEAEKHYKDLESDKHMESTPKLKEFLNEIWNRREDYIKQKHKQIIDISVRIVKQFLLNKCNSFTTLIIIDVMLNILDNHWCLILHALLKRKLIMETYTKFLPKDSTVMNTLEMNISGNEYRLDSKSSRHVMFRSDTLFCDCLKGRKGQLCIHLCAILHSIKIPLDLPQDKKSFYIALAGEEVQNEELKPEPDSSNSCDEEPELNDVEETLPNDENGEYYYVIKQEMEDYCDPLEDNETGDNSINNSIHNNSEEINHVSATKDSYETALKALNDEFRRLNRVFKQNPNTSNLETMGRLARELSKIRPVEKVNLSNFYVEVNDKNMDCNE